MKKKNLKICNYEIKPIIKKPQIKPLKPPQVNFTNIKI